MPELPEVEALATFLHERAVGQRIVRVELAAISALKTFDPPVQALEGRLLVDVRRYGKFLCLDTAADPGGPDGSLRLVTHLARGGWLHWRESLPPGAVKPGKGPLALRLGFATVDGELSGGFDLTEAGTQKRLAVYVVRNPLDVAGIARLGPDPLTPEFTEAVFAAILAAGKGKQLKGVLRDQGIIAGVGNAYSDEILHVAKLSPYKAAGSLTGPEVTALYDAVQATLRDAVSRSVGQGAGMLKQEKRSGMRVHGRAGLPCPVCGDTVREVSFADSSLQYCPTCQTGGKPLADRRLSRLLK
ncbi:MAG: Fpg/Nei family DNA glycosylase [Actinomycetota bacterium]|nr:MAG: Fpg/Nei family DNA glycosylase [Actinomycetota bacterium]